MAAAILKVKPNLFEHILWLFVNDIELGESRLVIQLDGLISILTADKLVYQDENLLCCSGCELSYDAHTHDIVVTEDAGSISSHLYDIRSNNLS